MVASRDEDVLGGTLGGSKKTFGEKDTAGWGEFFKEMDRKKASAMDPGSIAAKKKKADEDARLKKLAQEVIRERDARKGRAERERTFKEFHLENVLKAGEDAQGSPNWIARQQDIGQMTFPDSPYREAQETLNEEISRIDKGEGPSKVTVEQPEIGPITQSPESQAAALKNPYFEAQKEGEIVTPSGEAIPFESESPAESAPLSSTPEEVKLYDWEPEDPFQGLPEMHPDRLKYSQLLVGKESEKAGGAKFFEAVEGGADRPASRAMKLMQDAYFAEFGTYLYITSGGRSDRTQKVLHPDMDQATRDNSSHRRGHGFDILMEGLGKDSLQYKWLQKHAGEFGFEWPGYPHKTAGKEWWHWEFKGRTPDSEAAKIAKIARSAKTPTEANDPRWMLDQSIAEYNRAKAITGSTKMPQLLKLEQDIKKVRAPMQTAVAEKLKAMGDLETTRRKVEEDLIPAKKELADAKVAHAELDSFLAQEHHIHQREMFKLGKKKAKERLERADQMVEDAIGKEIDPWRKWGIWDENGDFQLSNVARTLGGIVGIAANLFATFASAMDKRPGTVPFMIWNMIEYHVDKDLKAQQEALEGKAGLINEVYTSAGKWRKFFGDSVLENSKNRETLLYQGVKEMERQQAHITDAHTKWAIGETINIMKDKHAEAKAEFLRLNMETALAPLKAEQSIRGAAKTEEYNAAQLVYQGLGVIATQKHRKSKDKGIPDKSRQMWIAAKTFRSTVAEIRDLWTEYGDDWNLMAKFGGDSAILKAAPGILKTDALKAMQRLHHLMTTNAARLHKFSGDTGPIAVQEQIFAMVNVPLKDDYHLGLYKINRLAAYLDMLTNPTFYTLSDAEMGALAASTSGHTIQQQTKMFRTFNDNATYQQGMTQPLPTLRGKELSVENERTVMPGQPGYIETGRPE